jgi:hypothetical protein
MKSKVPGTPEELRLHATAKLLRLTVEEAEMTLRHAELEKIAEVLRDHDVPATGEHLRELVTEAWRATAVKVMAWQGRIPWDNRAPHQVVFVLRGDQPLAGEWRLVGTGGKVDVSGRPWPFPRIPHLRLTWGDDTNWRYGRNGAGEPDWSSVYLHQYPTSPVVPLPPRTY